MDFPIIEDSTLVDRIEHVIALTWTQRLFSWPWRPWVKTRSWFTTVPSRQMLRIGNVVHMHPEAARALRAALARQRLERAEENFYRREFVPAAPYVKRVKPQMPPHRNPAEPVPFPAQPWRVADTGREAMDSMLDATEIKIPVLCIQGAADKIALINNHRRYCLIAMRDLSKLAASEDRDHRISQLMIEGAMLHLQADLDWLERCQEELE